MLINNRYQVIRSLGEGGFGQAYLAEDTQMPSKRRCVVKQLKPIASSNEIYELVQARFQREAAILEQLGENHPQIPRLYAYFTEDKNFYLVQEWIEGETLDGLTLPQAEASVRTLLTEILPVLEFVHGQGIIHRDIKPGNIILRSGSQQPVLIDFGAVKETINTAVGENSASSIIIGTPGYMATEQAAGRPLASSDLYSLALTAVYLLTGVPPQELPSDVQTGEILWQQTTKKVSSDLIAVLTKAIQYHPRDRYSSVQEMLAALTNSSSTSISSTHSSNTNSSSTNSLPTAPPQPTVIRPPISAQPPATAQLLTANLRNNIETAPTQVEAIANPHAQKSKSWYGPLTIVTAGLIGLAVLGTGLANHWGGTRPKDPTTEKSVLPVEIAEENSHQLSQTQTPPNVDKCVNLVAYDPEDSSVNLRVQPNGEVYDTLPNLSIVQREGPAAIEAGWNDVYIDGIPKGYIFGELLYRTTYQVRDAEDTSANLRQTANGKVIAALKNGTEVQFLGTDGSWTHVALSNGQSGYITTSRLADPTCF